MKKLLGILGAFSLTATAALATIACGPENVVEADYSEEGVKKVIEEIVAQPIEYEDKFLFNYDNTSCEILRSSISSMIMSEKTSLNLFSKLLNKIIIDKILSKLPLLFENYPDFTLYTILNASSEASEIFTNIANGEKGIFKSYDVCWNLYSINNIDSFEIFDGPTILTSEASLYGRATTTFKSTMNRHGTGAQYVISEEETSFFFI